jgi:hypothetical protein
MYQRQVRNQPLSSMLMLTKADAEWAANVLSAETDPRLVRFVPAKRFMGYEGYDGGVNRLRFDPADYAFKFEDWVCDRFLHALCAWGQRPLVPQSESRDP